MTDGPLPPAGPAGPLLEYPIDYPFKVIGVAAADFAEHARALLAAAGVEAPPAGVTVRESSAGKYLSVTLVVRLSSEGERQAVYRALRADRRVVYYL